MKDNYFVEILNVVKSQSTCSRLKVGAVLVKDGRIISTGWNGTVAGAKHCNQIKHTNHHEFSINNEIHAEANCIGYAARNGVKTEDTTLYVNISPCIHCAKLIKAAGISIVYYVEEYDNVEENGLKFLINSGVAVKKI